MTQTPLDQWLSGATLSLVASAVTITSTSDEDVIVFSDEAGVTYVTLPDPPAWAGRHPAKTRLAMRRFLRD